MKICPPPYSNFPNSSNWVVSRSLTNFECSSNYKCSQITTVRIWNFWQASIKHEWVFVFTIRTEFVHTRIILYFYLCKIWWVAIVGGLWRGIHGGFHKAVGLRGPGWQYLLLCFAVFFVCICDPFSVYKAVIFSTVQSI